MDVTVNARELGRVVGLVSGVLVPRSSAPALSGLRLRAVAEEGVGRLLVHGTDGGSHVEMVVGGVEVSGEGEVLVPARLLGQALARPAAQTVRLVAQDDRLQVRSGRTVVRLRLMMLEDHPRLPESVGGGQVRLAGGLLSLVEQRVLHAVATDVGRPALGGVRLVFSEGSLVAAATDAYRLAVVEGEVVLGEGLGGEGPVEVTVPAAMVRLLARLDVPEVEVLVGLHRVRPSFRLGGSVTVVSELIDGAFPAFGGLFPSEVGTSVMVGREELRGVVRRVATMVGGAGVPQVGFEVSEGGMVVSAEDPEVGSASEGVPAKVAGEGLVFAVNASYLVDALDAVGSEDVRLELSGPMRPVVVVPVGGGGSHRQLVMPLRVGGPR